jgi:two-component system, OmpR family, response regulator
MRPMRILIVEDDTELRRMYRLALAMAGFEVDEAADGIDALRMIENRAPDLVILDLILQVLDGLSVQQELAAGALTAGIPIVVVTGSNIPTDTLNVARVLKKPIMPDELIRTVRLCLDSGPSLARA